MNPVSECTCDGSPCVCDELAAMLSDVESVKIINKGFKVEPAMFDVGPGAAFSDGTPLVSLYLWGPNGPDPELENGQPAMTLGFTKEAAAKLMYAMVQSARSHGWLDDDEEA